MRRYWYYTCMGKDIYGHGVSYSDNGCFDLASAIEYNKNENKGKSCIITGWHEISKEQYEKLKIYFDNQPK